MCLNFYKVLVVQFPFLLCSNILGSIQSVSGPTHSWDSLLEERQRGQSGYPLGSEGSWYRDWGNQRKAEQQEHRAKGERGGRRRIDWGWRHRGEKGASEGREQQARTVSTNRETLNSVNCSFCQLIQVLESSSPREQYICFCQVP